MSRRVARSWLALIVAYSRCRHMCAGLDGVDLDWVFRPCLHVRQPANQHASGRVVLPAHGYAFFNRRGRVK